MRKIRETRGPSLSRMRVGDTLQFGNVWVMKVANYEAQTMYGKSTGAARYKYLVQSEDGRSFSSIMASKASQVVMKWSNQF